MDGVKIVERSHRPRRKGPGLFNLAVHVAISCGMAYVLYLIYQKAGTPQPTPAPVVKSAPVKPRVTPKPAPQPVAPPIVEVPQEEPKPVVPPQPARPAFEDAPPFVDLPPTNDDQITDLATVPDGVVLAIRSNREVVELLDEKITVAGRVVAGLRVQDGQLEFRWAKPTDGAAAIVRNSLLRLTAGNEQHAIALRSPVKVEAPKLELKGSLKIVGKCEDPPPVADVRFAFTIPVPTKAVEGDKPEAMAARDEVILRYDAAAPVATRVRVQPVGKVLRAEFESQYTLPSRDVEPLTIARGNRKLRELENLHADALDAQASLPRMRTYRSQLNGDLSSAQNMQTSYNGFENPVAVAQKATAIGNIQAEIVATDRNIAQAEQLVRDLPVIEQELQGIQLVAEFAQSLKNTPVRYRFYQVVDGQEIDLIVSE